ncbi:MAG: hypothetical protein ABIQ78_03725 [Dokdonella sp.]
MTHGRENMNSNCASCGSRNVTVSYVTADAREFGWPSGVLSGVKAISCADCGEAELEIPAHGAVAREYREQLCRLSRRLLGDEYAYLRRALGATGRGYAEQLGVTNVTISRAENGEDVPALQDAIIRALTLLDIETRGEALSRLSERCTESVNVDVRGIARRKPMELADGWQTIDAEPRETARVIPLRRRPTPQIAAEFEATELHVDDGRMAACL